MALRPDDRDPGAHASSPGLRRFGLWDGAVRLASVAVAVEGSRFTVAVAVDDQSVAWRHWAGELVEGLIDLGRDSAATTLELSTWDPLVRAAARGRGFGGGLRSPLGLRLGLGGASAGLEPVITATAADPEVVAAAVEALVPGVR